MKAYQNAPDWRNLARAARNEWVPHVPLYEHIVGAKVIYEITGNRPYDGMFSPNLAESREAFKQYWDFWRRMGYDTASMEFAFTGILPGAGALGGHKEGAIKTREDFERYPWEELPERFFARYAPYIPWAAQIPATRPSNDFSRATRPTSAPFRRPRLRV